MGHFILLTCSIASFFSQINLCRDGPISIPSALETVQYTTLFAAIEFVIVNIVIFLALALPSNNNYPIPYAILASHLKSYCVISLIQCMGTNLLFLRHVMASSYPTSFRQCRVKQEKQLH